MKSKRYVMPGEGEYERNVLIKNLPSIFNISKFSEANFQRESSAGFHEK